MADAPWPPSGDEPPLWMTEGAHPDAEAMFVAFWKGSHNNGFDWHLGRFLPTHYPANDKGCLVILQTMHRGWGADYGGRGVVDVDWIMSLKGHDGAGTIAMKWLCALADEHDVVLILVAGSGPGGRMKTLPTRVLQAFYKRFGFVKHGRDPKAMHRLPRGA